MRALIFCLLWRRTTSVASPQPILVGSSIVTDWVRGKCGESGRRLWKYHGALYDPLDGRKVASVEGLEWVRLLRRNETFDRPIYTQVLNLPNATWKNVASLWSKNLFCYTLEGDGGNGQVENKQNSTLLRSIRIRPYSPEKPIPLDQAAAIYETASTFIETSQGELIVHSEWSSPTKKRNNHTISLWGTAHVKRNIEDGSLGFSVYCKRRSTSSPFFLPDLRPTSRNFPPTSTTMTTTTTAKDSSSSSNASITVSPKRAKWIQFGMGNMDTSMHKFGARETYTLSSSSSSSSTTSSSSISDKEEGMTKTNFFRWIGGRGMDNWFFGGDKGKSTTSIYPRLTYSRYGEGPPFYAPGRMCLLELTAEPIRSLEEASPVIQQLLKDRVQGWVDNNDSNHPPSSSPSFGNTAFQGRLYFTPSSEEEGDYHDPLSLYKDYAIQAWEKVRSLNNLVSFFRKEKTYWNRPSSSSGG